MQTTTKIFSGYNPLILCAELSILFQGRAAKQYEQRTKHPTQYYIYHENGDSDNSGGVFVSIGSETNKI